jgi:hypothetical protein
MEVVVSVRNGKTRLTVQENLGNLIGGIWGIGGGMGGGGVGPFMAFLIEGIGLHGPGVALFVPVWLAITFATARTAYYYSSRRREQTLEELTDRLAGLAEELVAEQGGRRRPTSSPAPR